MTVFELSRELRKYRNKEISIDSLLDYLRNSTSIELGRLRYSSLDLIYQQSLCLFLLYGEQYLREHHPERFDLISALRPVISLYKSSPELIDKIYQLSLQVVEGERGREQIEFFSNCYDSKANKVQLKRTRLKKGHRSVRNRYYLDKQNNDAEYIQMVKRSRLKREIRGSLGLLHKVPKGRHGSIRRLPVLSVTSKRKSLAQKNPFLPMF